MAEKKQKEGRNLKEVLENRAETESFSDMMLRIMKEQDLTGPEVYKAANVSKSVFSKLSSDRNHVPRKHISLALTISLQLDPEETELFLKKAGYALSDYIESDVIVSYCISQGIKDVYEVNKILYMYGLPLLGSRR